jgi:hypothetical protein
VVADNVQFLGRSNGGDNLDGEAGRGTGRSTARGGRGSGRSG